MKLNIHIGHLLVDSEERLKPEWLAEAIRRELGQRIAVDGWPTQIKSSLRERASIESPEPDAGTTGLGGAIYGSLTP